MKLLLHLKEFKKITFFLLLAIYCSGTIEAQTNCSLSVIETSVNYLGAADFEVIVTFEGENGFFEATDDNAQEFIYEICLDSKEQDTFTFNYSCDDTGSYLINLKALEINDGSCANPDNLADCSTVITGEFPQITEQEQRCIFSVDDFNASSSKLRGSRVALLDFPIRSGGKKAVTANSCVTTEIIADYQVRGGCYDFSENPGTLNLYDYLFESGSGFGSWIAESPNFPTVNSNGEVDFSSTDFGTYSFEYTGDSFYGLCGEGSTKVIINYEADAVITPAATQLLEVCDNFDISFGLLAEAINFDVNDGLFLPSQINGAGRYYFYSPNDIEGYINDVDNYCDMDIYAIDVVVNPSDTYYLDNDNDGLGVDDAATNIQSCEDVSGYSLQIGDCDDSNDAIGEQLKAGEDSALEIEPGDKVTADDLFATLKGEKDPGGTWSPTPDGAATYTYTHAATARCSEDSAEVVVTEQTLSLAEENLKALKIFPNPTDGLLKLNGNLERIKRLQVFSLNGQLLMSKDNETRSIDLGQLEIGIYFLSIETENKSDVIKIIKK